MPVAAGCNCCQNPHPFQGPKVPWNVFEFDIDGTWLNAWATGHRSIAAICPKDDDLIVVGRPLIVDGVNSGPAGWRGQSVVERFTDAGALTWGGDTKINAHSIVLVRESGGGFTNQPVAFYQGAIDSEGTSH